MGTKSNQIDEINPRLVRTRHMHCMIQLKQHFAAYTLDMTKTAYRGIFVKQSIYGHKTAKSNGVEPASFVGGAFGTFREFVALPCTPVF